MNEPSSDHLKIDIEQVIRNKNPNLLRVIPGFLLQYIKKIIHQNDVNDFIKRKGDKVSFDFVDEIITEFKAKVTYTGLEYIPETGGAIIASNHPLGGLDAIALLQVLSHKRKDIKFIVNDVLLSIKNLNDLFIGVNKHGKNTTDVLNLIDSYYEKDGLVLIFPSGLVSRKQSGGVISDLTWKKSFIVKARKFNRMIIPVHIGGKNTNFFYNFARFREKIGIKANIEMFYLMDEMYKQKGKEVPIMIGKPILPSQFNNKYADQDWAQMVKQHIYKMRETNNPELPFNP